MPMRPRLGFSLICLDIVMVAIFPLTASAQSKRYNYVLYRTMLDNAATAAVVSAGQLAHTSYFTHKITANIWGNKINTGIGIYKDNRVLYATEHNVLSILGDHEYKGHYVMGISSESRAYNFQEKASNWSLISQVLKSYIQKFCIK